LAPSANSRLAVAAPMPLAPPVTIVVRWANLFIAHSPCLERHQRVVGAVRRVAAPLRTADGLGQSWLLVDN